MSKLADDLCAEVRRQCDQAEHFKGLWMQSSDELEKARKQRDKLLAALERIGKYPASREDELGYMKCRAIANAVIAEVRGGK